MKTHDDAAGPDAQAPWPFRAVRSCLDQPVQLHVLEMNPDRIQPAVSVQPAWNRSRGIIRGVQEEGCLVEDFIGEELDRDGRLAGAGRRICGADEMRRQVWTAQQHQRDYLNTHPHERILAWTGNGNLLSNPCFVAEVNGQRYHLAGEEKRFALHPYSCLVVWRHGQPRRVSVESLDLGRPLPAGIECFTTGQRLVENGKPLDNEGLIRLARQKHFYDLRHLFLFGRLPRGGKRWIDAGLAAFWRDGEMETANLERALRGGAVTVDISQFDRREVTEAMHGKDYVEVGAPASPGEFSIQGNTLRVVLLEGIYPHHMFGIREDGTVLSVVLRGLSNRTGVTVLGAAGLMKRLGARDALLLDNGGDVMLSYRGETILGSAEGERNRLRSILLFRHPADLRIQPSDARLITYPEQLCLPLNPTG